MAKKTVRKLYVKENIVIFLLFLIVIWFFGTLVVNHIHRSMVQTVEVKQTTLEQVDVGYGLVSGRETGVIAPADGVVEPIMAEGSRVRKGNAVFRVNDSIAYTNDAGLVSYQLDGLEGVTDLNAICSTDLVTRYEAQQNLQESELAEAVANNLYAKVINTFDDIYLYLTVDQTDYTNTLEADQQIPVRFVDLDYEVQAGITEVLDTADGTRYLKLKLTNVKEKIFQQRIYQVELPYNRLTAIAVPTSALMEKDGEQGVYELQKGFVFWKTVVVGQTRLEDDMVVIEEGLESGDIVVTTPQYVREGENIKF